MAFFSVLRAYLVMGMTWLIQRLPFFRNAEIIPGVSPHLEAEQDKVLDQLQASLKPYHGTYPRFKELPTKPIATTELRAWLLQLSKDEDHCWRQGFVSGTVYHGQEQHIAFLNEVYGLFSQANPLHSDIWPSINKFEAEIVAMTAKMLGAEVGCTSVGGTVTSGGSESILLAMKTYRDWARREKGIKHPEAIIPVSAHAAFDKACQYFSIKKVTVPLTTDYQACLAAVKRAVTRNTIVIVGSAPSFPHGIIDPIAEMAALAQARGIGFHTDACLGGFLLPWVDPALKVAEFDFRVPGVTSISADTHKFGFASKGSSVLLFRDKNMRHYQYFVTTEWPGGIYFSPTFAGSRPGALIAQCWAAMLAVGEDGYRQAAAAIMHTANFVKQELIKIPGIEILGDPLWVIAFTSKERNIYDILDKMAHMGWRLNGLHHPLCLHICITLVHTKPGIAERFIADLRQAAEQAAPAGSGGSGLAPVYGMAAQIPLRGVVARFIKKYLDRLYEV